MRRGRVVFGFVVVLAAMAAGAGTWAEAQSFAGDTIALDPTSGPPGTRVTIQAYEVACPGGSRLTYFATYDPSVTEGSTVASGQGEEIATLTDGTPYQAEFTIPSNASNQSAFALVCPGEGGTVHLIQGFPPLAGTTPTPLVAGLSPPHERGSLASSLLAPGDVSTDTGDIAVNLLIAGMMLLLVFPAELFNATLEEHYDEVTKWLRGPRSLLQKTNGSLGRRGATAGFVLVTAATAILYGFLDPHVAFDEATISMVLGIGLAIGIAVLVGGTASRRFVKKIKGDEGKLRAYPAALIVALVCVLISRIANFQPGYLYGIVAGIAFTASLATDEDGKSAARAAVAGLVAAVVAWIVWIPIGNSASGADANIVVLTLDAFLAAMFVGGLQALVFGFVPIRYLPGAKVWAWSKAVWLLLFGIGSFGFLHVLLHPDSGYDGSLEVMLVLFLVFATASGAFWAYFRFRTPKAEPAEAPVLSS